MRASRPIRLLSRLRRKRRLRLYMLSFYVLASIGVAPTPAFLGKLANRLSSNRFPCGGGSCGCSTVRESWTVCSCHTLEEKVVWAHHNHVPIPSYVDLSGLALTPTAPPAHASCAMGDSCGAGMTMSQCHNSKPQRTSLPTLSPMGCKGLQSLMALAVVPATMPTTVTMLWDSPETQTRPSVSSPTPRHRVLETPTPPPRV